MAGEIIEKITSIDEQIHDLKRMVLESKSRTEDDENKSCSKSMGLLKLRNLKKNGQKQPLLSLK